MNTLVKLLNRKLELFVSLNDISIIKALNQAFLLAYWRNNPRKMLGKGGE